MPRNPRFFLTMGVLCLKVTWSSVGLAEDESKQRCVAAYEAAQVLMRKGNLTEAKAKLVYCGGAHCPAVMQGGCERWLSDVEASLPTVVFHVKPSSGALSGPVSISIDGGNSVTLDGRAISVDPGEHQVAFSAQGLVGTTKVFVFSEGEKLRREVVVLEAKPVLNTDAKDPHRSRQDRPAAEQPENSGGGLTMPIVVAASVAVLGGVGVGYFGLKARAEDRDLGACTPDCSQTSVDTAKRDYLLANISLGVAAASLATAAVLVVLEFRSTKSSRPRQVGLGFYPATMGLSATGNF